MLQGLLFFFYGIAAIQALFYLFLFSRFSFSSIKKKENISTPVSVIICAKNEALNLHLALNGISKQKYANFEMVLIDDRSTDQTLEIMEDFQKKHAALNIKIVRVKDNELFWGSKKYALTLGIKAASNEHLLFTDADCIPTSEFWIQEMMNHFNNKKSIVLGYGAYHKIKKSFLNKLIRFETLMTAIQYFSYAKIKLPYMGVGRNIAYTKTQFFKNNGFANHLKIRSGDDDLFVNENATKKNTASCYSTASFTSSIPKKTLSEWILQKRRHVSTASHYKPIHQFLLGLYFISKFLFWTVAIALLAFSFSLKIVLLIIISSLILQYIIIGFAAKKLNEKDLIVFIPFLKLFLITMQMIIFIKNKISKPLHW